MEDLTVQQVWEWLIAYLSEFAEVRETARGLEVEVRDREVGATPKVEIVVTRDDWDDYVSTIFGTGDPSVTPIKGCVLAAAASDSRSLIYDGSYDWVAGGEPAVPADVNPDVEGARWFVVDKEGREVYFPDDPSEV